MPQDAFTLRHLCRELNSLFRGGKINKIVQSSIDDVVFSVYTGEKVERLLLSVNPARPRIAVTFDDPKAYQNPPFVLLLRKYLSGATINGIELCGFDRIVKIHLTPSKEFFDQPDKILFVELMGRYSNIILTENGKILGGNRGINSFADVVRPLFTGRDYIFPPVNDKLLPEDEKLIEVFRTAKDISSAIISSVQGVAKSTADWLVLEYSKLSNTDDVCAYINKNAKDFYQYMLTRLYSDEYKPCVSINDGVVEDVFVTPYADGEYKFFDTLYLAEDYYFTEKLLRKQTGDLRTRANSIVNTHIKKATKRLNAVLQKERDAEGLEENKIKGELIIANIYKFRGGEEEITLDNYYDGTKIKIALDKTKSPSQNAETYFKKYAKQKRALEALKPQIDMARAELDYYLSVQDETSLCETAEDYKHILREIKPDPVPKGKKREEVSSRVYEKDGFIIRVGRSNVENDKLLSMARRDSVWLHVKDYHSSHALIEANGKVVPDYIVRFGAELTAYYSKCRDTDKAEVVYTQRKYVKKPNGAKPGFVTYDNFKSIVVKPNKHEEFIKAD